MTGSFLLFALLAGSPPVMVEVAPPPKDADKIVCKSRSEIGSRLSRVKECATKAQWEEQARADKEMMGDISERSRRRGSD